MIALGVPKRGTMNILITYSVQSAAQSLKLRLCLNCQKGSQIKLES